jgi:hypothetical protein
MQCCTPSYAWRVIPVSSGLRRCAAGWNSTDVSENLVASAGKQAVLLPTCFTDGLLHALAFGPEDGGDMLARNVGWLLWTTLPYTPEDGSLHDHCCEDLKTLSYIPCSEGGWINQVTGFGSNDRSTVTGGCREKSCLLEQRSSALCSFVN